VLEGVAAADWPRIRQVVVETHSDELRHRVRRLLGTHFATVGDVTDDALEACGLERAVVFAREPLIASG